MAVIGQQNNSGLGEGSGDNGPTEPEREAQGDDRSSTSEANSSSGARGKSSRVSGNTQKMPGISRFVLRLSSSYSAPKARRSAVSSTSIRYNRARVGGTRGNGKTDRPARVKGKSQENQFQTLGTRVTDNAIEIALLQSLSSVRCYVRAEGSAPRNDCYATNSQTENQNLKSRPQQPAMTPRAVSGDRDPGPSTREPRLVPIVDRHVYDQARRVKCRQLLVQLLALLCAGLRLCAQRTHRGQHIKRPKP